MKIRRFDEAVMFHCPGCGQDHMILVTEADGITPVWGFNGSDTAPTFSPSILARSFKWMPEVTPANLAAWQAAPWPQRRVERICHSLVTDGRIRFLEDCTHHLAGHTVDLPDWSGK